MTLLSRWTSFALSVAVLLAAPFFVGTVPAQAASSSAASSSQTSSEIAKALQDKLLGLTNYGVFDWLTFRVHDHTVFLNGYASGPGLKNSAERAAKSVEGVDTVKNKIKVLPPSGTDDQVRASVYTHIYTFPSLRMYNANQGGYMQAIGPIKASSVRMGGSVVNFPPTGYNAIHIIVDNGNVKLYGIVNTKSAKEAAGIRAKGTPGTFNVENHLIVQGSKKD